MGKLFTINDSISVTQILRKTPYKWTKNDNQKFNVRKLRAEKVNTRENN